MIYSQMIMLSTIIVLSIVFFRLLYEILLPYDEKIFIFFTRKGKSELKFIIDFVKGLGPNIFAVSVVAIFIPIKGVAIGTLFVVAFFGIIMSRVALLLERVMFKENTKN